MADSLDLPDRLSRREFLQVSALGLLGLGVPLRWSHPLLALPAGQFGRVADPTVDVFSEPSFGGEKLRTFWRDEVLSIEGAVVGDPAPEHNRVWYRVTDLGYVHSSPVQPVREEPNQPVEEVPAEGQLMEVTVPFVDVYWRPRPDAEKMYRYYYSTTHWVDGVCQDARTNKWYRILDDKWTYHYYARAEAFRPVPDSELAPISPNVPLEEKRIELILDRQMVQCYEGSVLVFSSRISSGQRFGNGDYSTPEGEYVTFRKRHSRHMAYGNLASAGYDLPGVPWVAYITEGGISFHGTYWHNDFGRPRSHGCINMLPHAAKWLFRWTLPVVPGNEQEVWVDYGTPVVIRR
jgi:hypothetical protein